MKNYNNIAKVTQLETPGGNLASSQYVIRDGNNIIFQSYNSTICIIDYDAEIITLGYDWDYSTTTSKYLYIFFRNNMIDIHGRKQVDKLIRDGKFEDKFNNWIIQYNENL